MILEDKNDGVVFPIIVSARASSSSLNGVIGDVLRVKVNSAPVEGKANDECIKLFSKIFNTAKSNIEITKGLKSRHKEVFVAKTNSNRILQILEEHII